MSEKVSLRSHQARIITIAKTITEGTSTKKQTVLGVTAGGGKSKAACLMAREMFDADFIDGVIWVCPRKSLTQQAAGNFMEELPGRTARVADNTAPLFRGSHCYTTTYQAVVAEPYLHEDEVRRRRCLVVLDEVHHLVDAESGRWYAAIKPLVENARHVLSMTGTPERHDRREIPVLAYDSDGRPLLDIEYGRRTAIVEQAILPIDFTCCDGLTQYIHGDDLKTYELSNCPEDEQARVIATALSPATEYFAHLLRMGLDAWQTYRRERYPSRAIVICSSQSTARRVVDWIEKNCRAVVPVLAISDEPDAADVLDDFRRRGTGDVLVTVGMAYEGLDVPDCTHLLCLTNVRSRPWLEQAFARVTRINRLCALPPKEQAAFIYVPDDKWMKEIIGAIREEERLGLKQIADRDVADPSGEEKGAAVFLPQSAEMTGLGFETEAGRVDGTWDDLIAGIRARMPHLRIDEILFVVAEADRRRSASVPISPVGVTETQNEKEESLRRKIETVTRQRDHAMNLDPGTTNRILMRQFKKQRKVMNVAELEQVHRFMQAMLAGDMALGHLK